MRSHALPVLIEIAAVDIAQRAHIGTQFSIFTGIGPEAKSIPVTLRIKYGIIPKKSGIYPNPAAESKVG